MAPLRRGIRRRHAASAGDDRHPDRADGRHRRGRTNAGTWVRYDGAGRPPVTDGPFAETKDLIAGWMVIDVDSYERAVELAGELSASPGPGGEPIHEWLELRPFLGASPTVGECHAGG